MATAVLAIQPETQTWIDAGVAWRIGWLALVVGVGAAAYGLVLLLTGMRPRHLARPVTPSAEG